jgi:type II secretory pathway component GspD/PulD (secretin)
LYLNFRDVPLSAVLNYLSAKAGLIVISDADLRGKVSVVAKQPVTTNDLVEMLNDALSKNGYAATLNGRTLNVMELSRAKTSANTPIIPETNVTSIPMTDEVVTGILPMASLNPTQLIKDLEPLIPSGDTVIANEGGNAIIMTAPQKDIHRIAQIISDLDSSSISDVEVFVLKYGDAKSVASELKEVFESADSDVARANTRNSFRRGGGGGGGFGGLFGGGFGGGGGGAGGGGGGDDQTGRNAQTHAVFTSDDLMNAVIASAPPSYMASVTNVINELDQPTDQITVMRVFKLKNADPTEVADEFTTLFQITSSSDQNNNNRSMGMRFVPPWMQQQPASSGQSDRMKRETAVNVVADRRIQAVIITASKDQMDEIAGVVASLDEGNSGVQHVKAFNIDGDPTYMQTVLNTLFSNPAHPQPATSTTTDPFAARQTATANSQQSATSQTTSGFGTTGGSSAP